MSIRLVALLSCDTCADSQFTPPPGVEAAFHVRQAAVENGWQCRRGKRSEGDRCPDCVVKANAMKEPGRIIPPMRLDELEQICRESREGTSVAGPGEASGQEGTA